MKTSLFLTPLFLLALLLAAVLPVQADECGELLEWEVLFALAHDEIVDYQTDTTIAVDYRVRACEVYISRVEEFLSTYPKYCDTQNSIKDLSEMRDNVQYIMQDLQSQSGSPSSGGSRY